MARTRGKGVSVTAATRATEKDAAAPNEDIVPTGRGVTEDGGSGRAAALPLSYATNREESRTPNTQVDGFALPGRDVGYAPDEAVLPVACDGAPAPPKGRDANTRDELGESNPSRPGPRPGARTLARELIVEARHAVRVPPRGLFRWVFSKTDRVRVRAEEFSDGRRHPSGNRMKQTDYARRTRALRPRSRIESATGMPRTGDGRARPSGFACRRRTRKSRRRNPRAARIEHEIARILPTRRGTVCVGRGASGAQLEMGFEVGEHGDLHSDRTHRVRQTKSWIPGRFFNSDSFRA